MKIPSAISILALSILNSQHLVLAQTITATSVASSLIPQIQSDVRSYASSAYEALPVSLAQEFERFIAIVDPGIFAATTALPFSAYASLVNEAVTGTPTWLNGAPSDLVSFVKSAATAEASIVNKDTATSDASGFGGEGLRVAAVVAAGLVAGVAFVL